MSFPSENVDLAVVGSGPAGLCSAEEAAKAGARVVVVDENTQSGGQLHKQIHRFFGSRHHGAGKRGFRIAEELTDGCLEAGAELRLSSTVLALFPRGDMMVDGEGGIYLLEPGAVVLATGASEISAAFPGWTLPGVMGAGAAQTLVNMHGVLPGKRVLMAGAGNVGLIVSYQLLQAGAEIVGLVDMADKVSAYQVHEDRVRREGVPMFLRHRLLAAEGKEGVEAVAVEDMRGCRAIRFKADSLCLALGLTPLIELAEMRGCAISYQPELGGFLPRHDRDMRTDREKVYVAGDTAGVEEASVAMEEGRIAGISAAEDLGLLTRRQAGRRKAAVRMRLETLRGGPYGRDKAEAKKRIYRG